jgi:hypothetical protein
MIYFFCVVCIIAFFLAFPIAKFITHKLRGYWKEEDMINEEYITTQRHERLNPHDQKRRLRNVALLGGAIMGGLVLGLFLFMVIF